MYFELVDITWTKKSGEVLCVIHDKNSSILY